MWLSSGPRLWHGHLAHVQRVRLARLSYPKLSEQTSDDENRFQLVVPDVQTFHQ